MYLRAAKFSFFTEKTTKKALFWRRFYMHPDCVFIFSEKQYVVAEHECHNFVKLQDSGQASFEETTVWRHQFTKSAFLQSLKKSSTLCLSTFRQPLEKPFKSFSKGFTHQLDCTVMRVFSRHIGSSMHYLIIATRYHAEEKKILLPCLTSALINKSKKEAESNFEKPSHALSP